MGAWVKGGGEGRRDSEDGRDEAGPEWLALGLEPGGDGVEELPLLRAQPRQRAQLRTRLENPALLVCWHEQVKVYLVEDGGECLAEGAVAERLGRLGLAQPQPYQLLRPHAPHRGTDTSPSGLGLPKEEPNCFTNFVTDSLGQDSQ